MDFFLIGPGRVGISMATLMVKAGHDLAGCWSRSGKGAKRAKGHLGVLSWAGEENLPRVVGDVEFVLVAIAESALGEVCRLLARAGSVRDGQTLYHVSGVYPSTVLEESAPGRDVHCGSIHPVQSVPSVRAGLELLPGSFFTIEGDSRAVDTARQLVEDMGGIPQRIEPGAKPLYHAGLSMSSNFLVMLAWLGTRLEQRAGVEHGPARDLVLSLMKGTLSNLQHMDLPAALTGPVLRGDRDTVRLHVEALAREFPEANEIYRACGTVLLDIARERGEAPAESLDRISELLGPGRG